MLVSIDHCLLWNEEMDALQTAVCRAAGVSSQQLHIAFTHTHGAGLMDPQRANLPGGELIAGYLELLADRVGDAARQAIQAMEPGCIVYGTGRCGLARNRDFWDEASGQFVCGYNPNLPADDTLLVARLADGSGRTVATVVNYACHPTTLAWDNTLVSPDFVGTLRELVENATGAPSLFLQGASGDLGPREGYTGDVAVADRNGRQLGYAALAALESLGRPGMRFEYTGPVVSGATIGTWNYQPLGPTDLAGKRRWRTATLRVDLPYRSRSSHARTDRKPIGRMDRRGSERSAPGRTSQSAQRAGPSGANDAAARAAAVLAAGQLSAADRQRVADRRRLLGFDAGRALQRLAAIAARTIPRQPNTRRHGDRRLAARLRAHGRKLRQRHLSRNRRGRGARVARTGDRRRRSPDCRVAGIGSSLRSPACYPGWKRGPKSSIIDALTARLAAPAWFFGPRDSRMRPAARPLFAVCAISALLCIASVGRADDSYGRFQFDDDLRGHWSFRPLERPAVPTAPAGAWARNPIDAFVLTGLQEAGLKPAPPAARATLLRRVYLDLIGLPPTPAELDAFLADTSDTAFEKVVDQLLARPQYGERWARHWLDVVRYAETNGYERDGAKPQAWRYRDWVIDAFNDDMPYDRFLIEQLAGDEIDGSDAHSQIATTMLRLGPWDDEPADPLVDRYDQLDDIVAATSATFLGLTLRCARCHDHKFEPLSQKDYTRWLTIFSPLKRPQKDRTDLERDLGPYEEVAAHQALVKKLDGEQSQIEGQVATPRVASLRPGAHPTDGCRWRPARTSRRPSRLRRNWPSWSKTCRSRR